MELLEAEDGYAKVTMEIKAYHENMHYLVPARGEHLIGEGHVQKMGKQIALSYGEVKDEHCLRPSKNQSPK